MIFHVTLLRGKHLEFFRPQCRGLKFVTEPKLCSTKKALRFWNFKHLQVSPSPVSFILTCSHLQPSHYLIDGMIFESVSCIFESAGRLLRRWRRGQKNEFNYVSPKYESPDTLNSCTCNLFSISNLNMESKNLVITRYRFMNHRNLWSIA